MRMKIRGICFLAALLLCLSIGAGRAEAQGTALPPQEEYGSELRRGRLIRHADPSTSRVVDWREAPKADVKEYAGDREQFVYKRTKITDGYHTGDDLELFMRVLYDGGAEAPRPAILFVPGGALCPARSIPRASIAIIWPPGDM